MSLNLYDNGDKDFHSKEQQLNISKTLRSVFPNHRTTTSVFLYPGIGIHESAGSFYLQKKEEGQESEQIEKSEIRIDK